MDKYFVICHVHSHLNPSKQMMTEKNTPQKKQANANLNIKDFLNIALANWVWFLLSVIVCVGISYYKLKKSPNIYYRSASVLIKDQSSGTRTADASSAFYEVSTLRMNNSIQNEILIFKSKRLMMEVARKLDLDVYYSQEGKFRDWDLYNECPVKLSFPEARENATFSFKVTPFSAKEVWLSDFSTPTWTGGKIKATLNDTLKTPIGKVVVTPSLFYSKDCFGTPYTVTKANLESTALRYNAALQATIMNDNSSMISLGISDVSPRRAEDILNTLIDVYNQDAIDDKNRMSVNTANFINERLIIIEQELGGVESQIADFKRQNRFTDFATQTGTYVEASNKYQEEGVALEGQLTLTRYIRDYLMDPSKSNELLPSNTGISDVNIEGQISQYNALMLQRDKLLANSSTKNPVVMDINNSLSAMKQTMIRTVDNAIAALNMKISNIRGEEERALRRIAAVPSQQKYVLSVERQQKIKESLYIYLLNKREENALTQSMAENNARVIDPATGSNAPISPNAQQILLIGLAVGLAIPAGILILINLLDTRIRTKKDLEDNLSIPFLGEIPQHAKEKGEKRKAIVVKEDGKDSVSEAFRILRTNMAFMNTSADHRMQSIMVTSLNVGAGKTFISSNLAMTLALAGKKVVLVDLDIRKGTLSAKMDKKKEGVTNYLAGNITNLDSIIYPSELHQNLSIVYNGPVPPNPAELLLSPHLNDLVDRLKERFDYVLLDNVPSNMVADAMIVNRVADLTIYVVRAGNMDKRQLPEIERLYTEGKLKNMAVVLNGVKTYKSGYGYYGYYGYGYGYGYGEGKKKKKRKLF